MSETHVFLKYDGSSEALKKHRIEAKQLGEALIELADLIYDANTTLNGVDSYIDVQAKAGFIKGSFGLELIIDQNVAAGAFEVAKYIGFGASAIAGSLLSILKNKGEREPDLEEIIVNEVTGSVTLKVGEEEVVTTPEVVNLLKSRTIRRRVSKIINKPLEAPGVDFFQVLESADTKQKPLLSIDKDESKSFSEPPRKKSNTLEEADTVATIEFLTSNKEKGTSGWKMRHLGRDVPVRVKDPVFLEAIKRESEPSIYGHKYKVDLHYKKTKSETGERDIFTITKVRSRV